MWRVQMRRNFQTVILAIKPTLENHGAVYWMKEKWPRLMELNRNTFWREHTYDTSIEDPAEITIEFGDTENTIHSIPTAGLSCSQLEEILKSKVEFSKTLKRQVIRSNDDRDIPMDIIESRMYVKYRDDGH